jgi:F0F1-type ATP synthase delta subunit
MGFIKRGDGKIISIVTSDKELTEEQKKAIEDKIAKQSDQKADSNKKSGS